MLAFPDSFVGARARIEIPPLIYASLGEAAPKLANLRCDIFLINGIAANVGNVDGLDAQIYRKAAATAVHLNADNMNAVR